MKTISHTEARSQLAGLLETATRDREPITITRNGAGAVVMPASGEFSAMEETLHLLPTPANAGRIRQGLKDHASGNLQSQELCD